MIPTPILMVEPVRFYGNTLTQGDNYFQQRSTEEVSGLADDDPLFTRRKIKNDDDDNNNSKGSGKMPFSGMPSPPQEFSDSNRTASMCGGNSEHAIVVEALRRAGVVVSRWALKDEADPVDENEDDVLELQQVREEEEKRNSHRRQPQAIRAAAVGAIEGSTSTPPQRQQIRSRYDNKPDAIFPNNSISIHELSSKNLTHLLQYVEAHADEPVNHKKAHRTATTTNGDDKNRIGILVFLYPMCEGRRDELPASLLRQLEQRASLVLKPKMCSHTQNKEKNKSNSNSSRRCAKASVVLGRLWELSGVSSQPLNNDGEEKERGGEGGSDRGEKHTQEENEKIDGKNQRASLVNTTTTLRRHQEESGSALEPPMLIIVDLRPFQDAAANGLAPASTPSLVLEGTGAINFSPAPSSLSSLSSASGNGGADGTCGGGEAYACESQRCHPLLFHLVCDMLSIPTSRRFLIKSAVDGLGRVIYHTNVVGWVGSGLCAWDFESLRFVEENNDKEEKEEGEEYLKMEDPFSFSGASASCCLYTTKDNFLNHIHQRYPLVIHLTTEAVGEFCGNAAFVVSSSSSSSCGGENSGNNNGNIHNGIDRLGVPILALSSRALAALEHVPHTRRSTSSPSSSSAAVPAGAAAAADSVDTKTTTTTTTNAKEAMESFMAARGGSIVDVPISHIETLGGGSMRCLLAFSFPQTIRGSAYIWSIIQKTLKN